jgi:cell division control protein 6
LGDTMEIGDILSSEETLFRNQEVFNPDYIPEQFLFRDGQIRELMFCLKPALSGGRPSSAFIHGEPATGKTTSVRLVFKELMEATSNVVPVYINCHLQSSAFRIFSEMRRAVVGMPAPDTGIPITRVQDDVFSRLGRDHKTLVVCLDDINYLFSAGIADDVLYNILRAHEAYPGVRTAVFAVSTEEVLHKLSSRVRSIFSPVRVNFPPYSTLETYEILCSRRDCGIYPDVISDDLLRNISSRTKDLRYGIELLKQVVLTAESDASKVITEEHVEKAIRSMEPPEASNDKMLLLSLVRENQPMESGKLFTMVSERREMSYTGFYRMLKKLEAGGFVEIESATKARGRTSIIRAK